jgi:RNA polymerase sigma factor (sigma-70 family)
MVAVAFRKGVREPDIPVVNTLIKVVLRFDPRIGYLRPFLWWVLTDELNSAYRDQAKRADRTEPLAGAACDTPDEKVARQQHLQELAEELATALRTLPLKDQLLITLHYYDGLTLEEIAQLG